MTDNQEKIPANVKKMEIVLKEMEEFINIQKNVVQQTEKKFQQFKKFANTFIEQSRKLHQKKPRKPSGFVLPVPASNELCHFLNIPEGTEVSRTEVTKYLIQYIQEKGLSNPEKKTLIIPDEALGKLIGPDVDLETLTRFTIQKYMNKHYISSNTTDL
jgi:chromatin remodeling complex protein RSC6